MPHFCVLRGYVIKIMLHSVPRQRYRYYLPKTVNSKSPKIFQLSTLVELVDTKKAKTDYQRGKKVIIASKEQ